jgi:hypothetical protein
MNKTLIETDTVLGDIDKRFLRICINKDLKAYHWHIPIGLGQPYRIVCSDCKTWIEYYDGLLRCNKCDVLSNNVKIGVFNYAKWEVDVKLL